MALGWQAVLWAALLPCPQADSHLQPWNVHHPCSRAMVEGGCRKAICLRGVEALHLGPNKVGLAREPRRTMCTVWMRRVVSSAQLALGCCRRMAPRAAWDWAHLLAHGVVLAPHTVLKQFLSLHTVAATFA